MPYIKLENRKQKQRVVEELLDFSPNKDLEEVLFSFCKRYVEPSYNNYKNYIGELNECKDRKSVV